MSGGRHRPRHYHERQTHSRRGQVVSQNWVAIILLVAGVAGVILRPARVPAWVVPVAAAVIGLSSGAVNARGTADALRPLAAPIGFLLVAVPLALLLDQIGFFRALAERLSSTRSGPGGLWVLGALVITVLNLDAGVVLLTPLYVAIARERRWDPLALAFQPVLLACLASSALPVSNLTNLIAASWTGADTAGFLAHLALPQLAACSVGWWRYKRVLKVTDTPVPDTTVPDTPVPDTPVPDTTVPEGAATEGAMSEAAVTGPGGQPSTGESDGGVLVSRSDVRRPLLVGGIVAGAVLVGFTAGDLIGLEPWMVAAAADIALLAVVRRFPWRHVPVGTALVAAALAVLAAGAVAHEPIREALGGTDLAGLARTSGISALAANVANNLPALLILLTATGHRVSATLWAVLLGVNMGPVLLVTGSLASLLWLDTVHRLHVPVRARDFSRVGIQVGLPAGVAALAVTLALAALGV